MSLGAGDDPVAPAAVPSGGTFAGGRVAPEGGGRVRGEAPEGTSPLGVSTFLRFGFWLAFVYCTLGLAMEIARPWLKRRFYEHLAEAIYLVPTSVLAQLGLAAPLGEAAIQGHIPDWLAAAAAPAVAVALIFSAALLAFAAFRFGALLSSLKNR